jgi:hypothetical protein
MNLAHRRWRDVDPPPHDPAVSTDRPRRLAPAITQPDQSQPGCQACGTRIARGHTELRLRSARDRLGRTDTNGLSLRGQDDGSRPPARHGRGIGRRLRRRRVHSYGLVAKKADLRHSRRRLREPCRASGKPRRPRCLNHLRRRPSVSQPTAPTPGPSACRMAGAAAKGVLARWPRSEGTECSNSTSSTLCRWRLVGHSREASAVRGHDASERDVTEWVALTAADVGRSARGQCRAPTCRR